MATKKYKVRYTNILHNGELYKIGDVIELDDKSAAKLQDVITIVKEASAPNKNQTKTPKTNTPAQGEENGK